MSNILVSGLSNIETTVKVRKFPVDYYPIDYPFFGIQSNVSGVAYNVAKALKTLNDNVSYASMLGDDLGGNQVRSQLKLIGISDAYVVNDLSETPQSVVLYDNDGKRQIYCDLKDIQDRNYVCNGSVIENSNLVVACNINFNRSLLIKSKELNKTIATDVHVLSDVNDEYNHDFMKYGDILFLSDENIPTEPQKFIESIERKFQNKIIVMGRGSKGALMYVKKEDKFYNMPAVKPTKIVNTVGAGDSLFSAFVHFYAKGDAPSICLEKAQLFASIKIAFNGAAEGFSTEETIEKEFAKLHF